MRRTIVIACILACCLALTQAPTGAARDGDMQKATFRIVNADPDGKIFYQPVGENFYNTHQGWEVVYQLVVNATQSVATAAKANYTLSLTSINNGKIQVAYRDKFGIPHRSEVFTVRHGAPVMVYDVKRRFNGVRFLDAEKKVATPDNVFFVPRGVAAGPKDKCPKLDDGYWMFPMYGAADQPNFLLTVAVGGRYHTIPLPVNGVDRVFQLDLQLPGTE